MIIFKFILARFKQNLLSGCSNIYDRRAKTTFVKEFIYKKNKNKKKFLRQGGSFEPPGQHITRPLKLKRTNRSVHEIYSAS